MSQHIGDLSNYDALHSYEHSIDHLEPPVPRPAGSDRPRRAPRLHGDALRAATAPKRRTAAHRRAAPSRASGELSGRTQTPADEPAIGVIFDGTGLGTGWRDLGRRNPDRRAIRGYRRFAHLRYIPLPGGDAATLRPYRTALAHLWGAGMDWETISPRSQAADAQERAIIRQQLEKRLNAPNTSSMGRLFDAVGVAGGRAADRHLRSAGRDLAGSADRSRRNGRLSVRDRDGRSPAPPDRSGARALRASC